MLNIALVGNPNAGKTTLFNALTGLRQKVGNFPGITVDKKVGSFNHEGEVYQLTDLPGIYSLTPKSIDEQVSCGILLNTADPDKPDAVVLVLDASNLKRNLFLATQIIDLGYPTLVALNMQDIAEKSGVRINHLALQEALGCNVVPIAAKRKIGLQELKASLKQFALQADRFFNPLQIPIQIAEEWKGSAADEQSQYGRFKRLANADRLVGNKETQAELIQIKAKHSLAISEFEIKEIATRYGQINQMLAEVTINEQPKGPVKLTERIDAITTHPVWGSVIFLLVFGLIFQAVFSLASWPMDMIDFGMTWVADLAITYLPQNIFTDFLIGGVWSGLAGIVVFVPQITILFGLVAVLEESGYMARVSFLNDRLLRSVGMSGKSVVSLVGGFACAVPAIMAARGIENWRERIITIMITPLLSCSARLPVYIFLIGFIAPDQYYYGFISLQGLLMLAMYILGVLMSVAVAAVLNYFLKEHSKGVLLLEMPLYRAPNLGTIASTMWFKGKTFVTEAGKIILFISMILWVLSTFGPTAKMEAVHQKYAQATSADLIKQKESELLQNSYAGHLGHFIEPAIAPLGFDWKIGIALITSFAAREVFVGSISVIYGNGSDAVSIEELRNDLKNTLHPVTKEPIISTATASSLLIFYVFAMQCMSTLAIARRETGSWKWPMIQLFAYTAIAYLFSFITYQVLV